MTLQELYDQHPEWRDLQMVLYTGDEGYELVGGSAMVYVDEESETQPVLVFSGN